MAATDADSAGSNAMNNDPNVEHAIGLDFSARMTKQEQALDRYRGKAQLSIYQFRIQHSSNYRRPILRRLQN